MDSSESPLRLVCVRTIHPLAESGDVWYVCMEGALDTLFSSFVRIRIEHQRCQDHNRKEESLLLYLSLSDLFRSWRKLIRWQWKKRRRRREKNVRSVLEQDAAAEVKVMFPAERTLRCMKIFFLPFICCRRAVKNSTRTQTKVELCFCGTRHKCCLFGFAKSVKRGEDGAKILLHQSTCS